MKEVNYNGIKITMYSSIEELPIDRFQAFNKYLMLDAGIGSDLNGVKTRLSNIGQLIKIDKKDDAFRELQNMSQALNFIVQNVSPEFAAFVCLCTRIGNTIVEDLSDDGIKKYLDLLGKKKLPIQKLREWFEVVKKKWMPS